MFARSIQSRGGLIQQQHGGLLHKRSRDSNALLLSAADHDATLTHICLVSVGKAGDEIVCIASSASFQNIRINQRESFPYQIANINKNETASSNNISKSPCNSNIFYAKSQTRFYRLQYRVEAPLCRPGRTAEAFADILAISFGAYVGYSPCELRQTASWPLPR